jgi:hypothetical protein
MNALADVEKDARKNRFAASTVIFRHQSGRSKLYAIQAIAAKIRNSDDATVIYRSCSTTEGLHQEDSQYNPREISGLV